MHEAVLIELGKRINEKEILGKNILELGSRNVNGSIRGYIEHLGASSYTGLDFISGVGVDIVADVCTFIPSIQYDVVISTEMLEHVKDWRLAIQTIKRSCKLGGLIILSARSPGMVYHGYPHDHWRFSLKDIAKIFSDCEILHLIEDWQLPGIIVIARKMNDINNRYEEIKPEKAPLPPPFIERKWIDLFLLKNAFVKLIGIS